MLRNAGPPILTRTWLARAEALGNPMQTSSLSLEWRRAARKNSYEPALKPAVFLGYVIQDGEIGSESILGPPLRSSPTVEVAVVRMLCDNTFWARAREL